MHDTYRRAAVAVGVVTLCFAVFISPVSASGSLKVDLHVNYQTGNFSGYIGSSSVSETANYNLASPVVHWHVGNIRINVAKTDTNGVAYIGNVGSDRVIIRVAQSSGGRYCAGNPPEMRMGTTYTGSVGTKKVYLKSEFTILCGGQNSPHGEIGAGLTATGKIGSTSFSIKVHEKTNFSTLQGPILGTVNGAPVDLTVTVAKNQSGATIKGHVDTSLTNMEYLLFAFGPAL